MGSGGGGGGCGAIQNQTEYSVCLLYIYSGRNPPCHALPILVFYTKSGVGIGEGEGDQKESKQKKNNEYCSFDKIFGLAFSL